MSSNLVGVNMYYYFLGCMVGSEQANMKMVRMVVKTKISRDAYVKVYSPDRAVMEYKKKVKRLVNQPLLPGYLLIETECDLLPVVDYFYKESRTSYGLVRYGDRSFYLRGSDEAFAKWIASQNGHITSSKIKVEKNLEVGRKITVLSGPLKDLNGKIVSIYKDTKVTVEIPFLDEIKRVNLPIEIVKEEDENNTQ